MASNFQQIRWIVLESQINGNGQRWDYGYDDLGQVASATKRFPDLSPIPGHSFSYTYDGIGNRLTATHGGAGTEVAYPEANTNALNQYGMVRTGGSRYILGESPAGDDPASPNPVFVNGNAASRAGGLDFYWSRIDGANATAPLWSGDTATATVNGVPASVSGKTWTPAHEVAPTHDFDGNLTSDGRWTYTWDADNRLSRMQATAAAVTAGVPHQRIDFAYDWQGRRVARHVFSSTDGITWTFQSGRRFLHDGWNLIAEYTAASAAPGAALALSASHTWGIDVSGTAQGAGGVGGLLASTLHDGASSETFLPSYDGNGNISAWSDPGGALLTRTDYSPFGQVVARYRLGPPGDARPDRLAFGFSTKFTDAESGLLYYGHRYLDPVSGRWLSRDPIGENGGVNLYGFVGNGGVNLVDYLGMADVQYHHWMMQAENLATRAKAICPAVNIHDFTTPYPPASNSKGTPHYFIHQVALDGYIIPYMGLLAMAEKMPPQKRCCALLIGVELLKNTVHSMLNEEFGDHYNLPKGRRPDLWSHPWSRMDKFTPPQRTDRKWIDSICEACCLVSDKERQSIVEKVKLIFNPKDSNLPLSLDNSNRSKQVAARNHPQPAPPVLSAEFYQQAFMMPGVSMSAGASVGYAGVGLTGLATGYGALPASAAGLKVAAPIVIRQTLQMCPNK